MKVRFANVLDGTVLIMSVSSGCETAVVKPWQRGDLARPQMAWQPDPMMSVLREHVYTAKEGASGGVGTGGGGCGCY